jgi:hypothetical protein
MARSPSRLRSFLRLRAPKGMRYLAAVAAIALGGCEDPNRLRFEEADCLGLSPGMGRAQVEELLDVKAPTCSPGEKAGTRRCSYSSIEFEKGIGRDYDVNCTCTVLYSSGNTVAGEPASACHRCGDCN